MSTNASISIQENKKITTIYNHWDGYIEALGETLIQNYTDPEKVKKLIELGDASSIGKTVEPSKLTQKFGFDGSLSDEFKALSSKQKHELRKDDQSDNYSLFYGRDRGEKDIEAREYNSIADMYRHEGQEYNYLFKDGKWYVSYSEKPNFKSLKDEIETEE
jgi:hypothetical protein